MLSATVLLSPLLGLFSDYITGLAPITKGKFSIDSVRRSFTTRKSSLNSASQSEFRHCKDKSSDKKQVNQSFVDSSTKRDAEEYSFRARSEHNRNCAPTMRSLEANGEGRAPREIAAGHKPVQELFDSENDASIMQRVLTTLESFAQVEDGSGVARSSGVEVSKKLAELKKQHEKDNKLFDQLIEEQKRKIRMLEAELMHLSERNQELEGEKAELQKQNEKLANSLNVESGKVSAVQTRVNEQSKEIAKLKKENDRLKEAHSTAEKSLEEAVKLLKSLLSIFVRSLSAVFTLKADTNSEAAILGYCCKDSQDKELFMSLKATLLAKLKALSASIPSLTLTQELQLVIFS